MQTTKENNMMTSDLERKPYPSDSMRVRCPHCRKLYLVQVADIREDRPRFECVQCNSRFFVNMADFDLDHNGEVIGLLAAPHPVTSPNFPLTGPSSESRVGSQAEPQRKPTFQPKREMQPCPKCFKLVQLRTAECPHCGVLIGRLQELAIRENLPPHSPALAEAWQKVIADYGNESVHVSFIQAAHREGFLAYAAGQYSQLSSLMPADETTRRHIREIQALSTLVFPTRERAARQGLYPRVWQVPLAAAVIMILVGIFLPVFRNMVGVGAAVFFIALALKFQLRQGS